MCCYTIIRRSIGVTIVKQLVWLTDLRAQPYHSSQHIIMAWRSPDKLNCVRVTLRFLYISDGINIHVLILNPVIYCELPNICLRVHVTNNIVALQNRVKSGKLSRSMLKFVLADSALPLISLLYRAEIFM